MHKNNLTQQKGLSSNNTNDVLKGAESKENYCQNGWGGGCPKMKNQKDGHSKYGADSRFDTLDLALGEAEKSIFGQSGGGL